MNSWRTLCALAAALSACSTGQKAPTVAGPDAPVGAEQLGPAPAFAQPVVVVLGPGLARSFAGIGVIKTLRDAKIRIGAVLGTEMGALIATTYARSKSINEFEWSMTRFRDSCFIDMENDVPVWSATLPEKAEFKQAAEKLLGNTDLGDLNVPVILGVYSELRHEVRAVERGRASTWIAAALVPRDQKPAVIVDGDTISRANEVRPFLIQEAKKLSLGPVIAIDTRELAGAASPGTVNEELSQADLVIRPTLEGVGPLDFKKRSTAMFRGAKAMREQLDVVRQLLARQSTGTTP